MQISQKLEIFLIFFSLHSLNLDSIFNIFKKKITLIADLFLTRHTPKNEVI